MGSGISIQVDATDEVIEAIEMAAGGEVALGELAAELADGVTLIVTFGDGSEYTYENVPADDAARIVADPGLYNTLLRGSTSSYKGRGNPLKKARSKFRKFLL